MITTYTSQKNKFIALLTAVLCLGFPALSSAQEAISVSVSPTIYDMTANPGQVWQSTVRIVNPNPFELTLSVTPNSFIPKDEDGIPQFIALDESDVVDDTLAEWITIEKEITIGPEQTYELPFQIMVPEGASPGGQYAALMISTKPAEGTSNISQVKTSQVISALVFLRVTGDINESGTIRSFRSTDYFLSKPETRFEVRVENRGNIHLQPQGEIKIYNMWGKERGTIPINQQTMLGNVLPQSVRKFSFEWSSEWSITDIGRYTAKVTLAYGVDERQFISADTAFWIIPWKIILTVIVVFGGLIATITWAIKLYIKRVLSLAGVTTEMTAPQVTPPPEKKKKTPLTAKAVAAPIEVSILDLRSKLQRVNGTWLERAYVYMAFVKTYWKFFVGIGAALLFITLLAFYFFGALTPQRPYQVIDSTGSIIAGEGAEDKSLQNAGGLPISIINRTTDQALVDRVSEAAQSVGFTIASSSVEAGVPEERTVIVYNPSVSEQALLLSRVLNNALLSAFTSTATSSEMIVVYVGKDAVATP